MIFVDTNVLMYAVGRPHPLRDEARTRLRENRHGPTALATSAEVLQELMHAYLPVNRLDTLDAALHLASGLATVWPVEEQDVLSARDACARHPGLSARDLLHLAVCTRQGASGLLSFDRGLVAAWSR